MTVLILHMFVTTMTMLPDAKQTIQATRFDADIKVDHNHMLALQMFVMTMTMLPVAKQTITRRQRRPVCQQSYLGESTLE